MKAHPAQREILEIGGKHIIPFRLFGDDGSLGKRSRMTLHHWTPCCSESSSTRASKIPLFALDGKAIKDVTGRPLLQVAAWSFAAALAGVYPSHDVDDLDITGPMSKMAGAPIAGPYRLDFVLYVPDWKQSVESFHLQQHCNCIEVCHHCKAVKDPDDECTFTNFRHDAACFEHPCTHEQYVLSGSTEVSPLSSWPLSQN